MCIIHIILLRLLLLPTFGYETVEQNDDLLPKAAAGRGTTGAAVLDTRLAGGVRARLSIR